MAHLLGTNIDFEKSKASSSTSRKVNESLIVSVQARVYLCDPQSREWVSQGNSTQYIELTSDPLNRRGRIIGGNLSSGKLVIYNQLTKPLKVTKQSSVWAQWVDNSNVTWALAFSSPQDCDKVCRGLQELADALASWNEYAKKLEERLEREARELEEEQKFEEEMAMLAEEERLKREEELGKRRVSLMGTGKQTKKAAKEVERLKKLGSIVEDDSKLAKEMKKRGAKKGHLMKAGKNMLEKWKDRWFVLEGEYLKYYKDESERDQLGQIACLTCQVNQVNAKGKKFCFEIITPKKPYKMYGESQEEIDEWMEAIRSVATMVMDHVAAQPAKPSTPASSSSGKNISADYEDPLPARAIFPYKRKQEKQLSVHVGDKLEVYYQSTEEGWLAAVNLDTGKAGWVPADFVQMDETP